MSLSGKAAVVIRFDRLEESLADWYEWHTEEHMPERMGIPGFRLGRRFISTRGPRFLIIYEADDMGVLSGEEYRKRQNNPTPLTRSRGPSSKNNTRGACSVELSLGIAQGGAMCALYLWPEAGSEARLRRHLVDTALPSVAGVFGVMGVHLCVNDTSASGTEEVTELKGRSVREPKWIVLVEGISGKILEGACDEHLSSEALRVHGVTDSMERDTFLLELSLGNLSDGKA